jgi:hypothetical protein
MSDQEAVNNRLATKMMRVDIHRILVRWDPMGLKGLRGAEKEYDRFVGPLLVMVKKGEDKMVIARHLADLLRNEWRMPENNAKCVEIASKMHNVGALYRGEIPR